MYHSDIKTIQKNLTPNGYLFSVTIFDVFGRESNVVYTTLQINDLYKFTNFLVKKGLWHSEIKVSILDTKYSKSIVIGVIDTEVQTATLF